MTNEEMEAIEMMTRAEAEDSEFQKVIANWIRQAAEQNRAMRRWRTWAIVGWILVVLLVAIWEWRQMFPEQGFYR